MGGAGGILQPFRTVLQLLGLDDQEITAGVDADIVELGRLPAQLLGNLHVALELPFLRGVDLVQRDAGPRIGQGEDLARLGAQE